MRRQLTRSSALYPMWRFDFGRADAYEWNVCLRAQATAYTRTKLTENWLSHFSNQRKNLPGDHHGPIPLAIICPRHTMSRYLFMFLIARGRKNQVYVSVTDCCF